MMSLAAVSSGTRNKQHSKRPEGNQYIHIVATAVFPVHGSFAFLANQIIVSEPFQAFRILTNHISVRIVVSCTLFSQLRQTLAT